MWCTIINRDTEKMFPLRLLELIFPVVFFVSLGESALNVSHQISRTTRHFDLTKKCFKDLGCFFIGAPFYDPVNRPLSLLPQDGIDPRFLLYNRPNNNTGGLLEPNLDSLRNSTFDGALETKVIVHGFLSKFDELGDFFELKDKLLTYGNYNVILLDWTHSNGQPYPQAVANARVVGAQLARLLQFLHKYAPISLQSVHIIGHSLGGHLAGWAGERLQNLGRISGLDPAGPYFLNAEDIVRLDQTDALFVDVIHTNGGTALLNGLGIWQPIGHIDFYPNGGSMQPGCAKGILPKIIEAAHIPTIDVCSHSRVVNLYLESIDKGLCSFQGLACDSWEEYQEGGCDDRYRRYRKRLIIEMGFHATKHENITKSQKFFLDTGDSSPYCTKTYT